MLETYKQAHMLDPLKKSFKLVFQILLSYTLNLIEYLRLPSWQSIKSSGVFKLQNLWAASHGITLLGTLTYVYASISNDPTLWNIAYRSSLIGTVTTYTIVLSRSNIFVAEEEVLNVDEQKSRVELVTEATRVPLSDLLKNENAQLLGYALLWVFTSETLFKILPFNLYSILNITTFLTCQIYPESNFTAVFTPCVNYFEIPLLLLASHLDILVYAILLKQSFEQKNAYALVIYSVIWLLRFETSEASRYSVNSIVGFLDYLFSLEPTYLYHAWGSIRLCLEIFIQLKERAPLKDTENIESDDTDEDSIISDFLNYKKDAIT